MKKGLNHRMDHRRSIATHPTSRFIHNPTHTFPIHGAASDTLYREWITMKTFPYHTSPPHHTSDIRFMSASLESKSPWPPLKKGDHKPPFFKGGLRGISYQISLDLAPVGVHPYAYRHTIISHDSSAALFRIRVSLESNHAKCSVNNRVAAQSLKEV